MTAIESMRLELTKIQKRQTECITEEGHVLTACRYEYAALVKSARDYQQAIQYLENMRKEENHANHIRLA